MCLIAVALWFQAEAQIDAAVAQGLPNRPPAASRQVRETAIAGSAVDTVPSWAVEGSWMTTRSEAVQDALGKAQSKIAEYLSQQYPGADWQPTTAYVEEHLLCDVNETDAFQSGGGGQVTDVRLTKRLIREEVKDFGEQVGTMYRVCLRVGVTPLAQKDIREQVRQIRAHQRQLKAAQILASMVAILVTVAGYLRLEDATRGYYTTWLRLAALAFVTLVGAGIWLLT
jgi:hypothetical protein